MQYVARYGSPLGPMTIACNETALVGVWFDGAAHFGSTLCEPRTDPHPLHDAAARWLDAYFAGQPLPELPPIQLYGTAFQQRVWAQLQTIPYGKTCTYGDLARALGSAPRAVGGAVGRNPISLLIPCHRVVGAGERLTGYAGGVARKEWLLAREKENPFSE